MSEVPSWLRRAEFAGRLSLLTSAGTLVCCALPAFLVAVGAGAVLASAVSAVPALVWLSEYKEWVFGVAGAMLMGAGAMLWRTRGLPCPANGAEADACVRARRFSKVVFAVSASTFAVGGLFAFVLPRLMQ